MKIISTTTVLELPETLETGSAKIMCDKPYRIERIENNNGDVIWFGYSKNWHKTDGIWYELVDTDFVECNIPEYEKLYLELNKKKYRKVKLEKITNEI